MSRNERVREIEAQLEALEKSKRELLNERSALLATPRSQSELPDLLGTPARAVVPSTPDEKVELFLLLFQGRESVYPKLWENTAKKTKGYAPACNNEWAKGLCGKPQVKCSTCDYQAFPKLDAQPVREHLQGRATIGTYAITEDDECRFLVADFDGDGWTHDVQAYRDAAREIGIQVDVERLECGRFVGGLEPRDETSAG